MNKTMTTLAAAALTAVAAPVMAQSSVTLFGVIDLAARSVDNGATQKQLATNGLNSSRLGFRGTEDLGGGLKANFWLEGAVNADDGTGAAAGGGQNWQRRATLGLQGPTDFVTAADPARYATQDSHVRFLGGLWLGVGLLFVAAAWRLRSLKAAVQAALVLIVIGGLARLSAQRFDVLLGPDILGSFVAEVALMPVLLLWSTRVARAAA